MSLLSSLWDRIRGREEGLSVEEAVIDSITATILFDEEVSDEELGYASGFIGSALGVKPERAEALIAESRARVEAQAQPALLATLTETLKTPEHRRMAMLCALAASHVDVGDEGLGEERFLGALAASLGMDDATVRAIANEVAALTA